MRTFFCASPGVVRLFLLSAAAVGIGGGVAVVRGCGGGGTKQGYVPTGYAHFFFATTSVDR